MWALATAWPGVDPEIHGVVQVTVAAASIWFIWITILFRSRLKSVGLLVHFALANIWFCLAHFCVGVLVWLAVVS